MKKYKIKGFIVLVILLIAVACSYGIHIDQEVDGAENYNVLVTTEVNGWLKKQRYYTKSALPDATSGMGYCNGTFVNFSEKTWILTAQHCILPINYRYTVRAHNTQDVVLIAIDTLLDGIPVLTSENEVRGLCNFSFFHLLGTENWHYRTVFGELTKPSFDEMFPKEQTEKVLNDLRKRLNFLSDQMWPESIPLNDTEEIIITAKDSDSLIRVLRKRFNVIQTESYKYDIEKCYIMEVSNDVAIHLAGPSGSSLRNYEGEIIGMYSRYRAPGPDYKQFAIFEKVDATMFE